MKRYHQKLIFLISVLTQKALTLEGTEKDNKITHSQPLMIAVQRAIERKPESPRAFSDEDKRIIYQSILKRSPLTKKRLLEDTYHSINTWLTHDYFQQHHDEISQKRSNFLEQLFPQLFTLTTCRLIRTDLDAQNNLYLALNRDPKSVQKCLYYYHLFDALITKNHFLPMVILYLKSSGFILYQNYYNKTSSPYSENHLLEQTVEDRIGYLKTALAPLLDQKTTRRIDNRLFALLMCYNHLKKNNAQRKTALGTLPKNVLRYVIMPYAAYDSIREKLQPTKNNLDTAISKYVITHDHEITDTKLIMFLKNDFDHWYDTKSMELAKAYTSHD